MINMRAVQIEKERRMDLMCEAERERILCKPASGQLLAWLGCMLVRLGQALQVRAMAHSHSPIGTDQKRRFELA